MLLRKIYPGAIWRFPVAEKFVYLTFDDGPVYGVTDLILDILKDFNVKATFFIVGSNGEKNPGLLQRMLKDGHKIGNHTYDHLNGFYTSKSKYLKDVEKCAKLIEGDLFRPPYGRMTPLQYFSLRKKYRIVMWDVLSKDYDPKISQEECFSNVINHVRNGSIIVFHDSLKASQTVLNVLPKVLESLLDQEYRFLLL